MRHSGGNVPLYFTVSFYLQRAISIYVLYNPAIFEVSSVFKFYLQCSIISSTFYLPALW